MEWIKANSLLTKVSFDGNLWFGIDYIMNLYKGCNHRCIYCDSRSDKYFIDNFDRVRGKEHTEGLLYYELRKNKSGVINFGAMSDAYNSEELKNELTRKALEQIYTFSYGISIETKSNQIVRDVDLIKQIQDRYSACIKFSITTADDCISKIIEPSVCCSTKRFEALAQLSAQGIYCGVIITPVLPFITDTPETITKIVKNAYESGAKFVYSQFGMTLRLGQREYYYQALDQFYPGIKEQYKRRYGNTYNCESDNSRILREVLAENCEKYGLLYQMRDIVEACPKQKQIQQLDLFA